MDKKFEFKVGDRVKVEGVLESNPVSTQYPLRIGDSQELSFTEQGFITVSDSAPVLQLIDRPKKKVKKAVERWMNVYANSNSIHHSEKSANDGANLQHRIACVKLTGEYEEEE